MKSSDENGNTVDVNKDLKEYKAIVEKYYEKSQETFEKQLSFISAGSLGFSMFFVEKIVNDFNKVDCRLLIIFSWLLLGLTLIINLISHLLSARSNYNTLKEINDNEYDFNKANSRIKTINCLNWITIGSLLFGILLFIIFVLLNI